MKAVISRSLLTCPFANLAVEDAMLSRYEKTKRKPVPELLEDTVQLLTWYNTPTVVVGRYQNQFLESNPLRIEEMGATLVRRRSGGGTVYHDKGCLCFSVITPRKMYSPNRSINMVASALKASGAANVHAGPRHDLWINTDKICGSAFRILSNGAYHHGTLLLETDLGRLKGALRPLTIDKENIKCRSVGSVRSPVVNVRDVYPGVDPEAVRDNLETAFIEEYGVGGESVVRSTVSTLNVEERRDADDLRGLVVAGSPSFSHRYTTASMAVSFESTKGLISTVTSCELTHNSVPMTSHGDCLAALLLNTPCGRDSLLYCLRLLPEAVLRSDPSPYEEGTSDKFISILEEEVRTMFSA